MPQDRCVVLGGGGLAGIAWMQGVLDELPPVLASAERVVGTSAGALLAARVLNGGGADGLRAVASELVGVRLSVSGLLRLLGAQVWPSRRHALRWIGRRVRDPRGWDGEALVELVARAIGEAAWPSSLVVVAVDAGSGRPAYFTARSGVELSRAVAASCAMPGALPAVRIEGRRYLDGGLRTPANADLAAGYRRAVVLAPQWRAFNGHRRPVVQAERLRAEGTRVVLVRDAAFPLDAMGLAGLEAARSRGRGDGSAAARRLGDWWAGPGDAR